MNSKQYRRLVNREYRGNRIPFQVIGMEGCSRNTDNLVRAGFLYFRTRLNSSWFVFIDFSRNKQRSSVLSFKLINLI